MAVDELQKTLDEWNPQPKKPTEADLQSILSKWDEAVSEEPPAEEIAKPEETPSASSDATTVERLDEITEYLLEVENERASLQEEKDAQRAIEWVKQQGIVPDLDDDFLRMRFQAKILTDDFFAEAWADRGEDPGRLESMLRAHGESIKDEYDEMVRKADHGLGAAVRMARSGPAQSGNSYSSLNFGKMSDAEYHDAKEQVFAAAKSGKLNE